MPESKMPFAISRFVEFSETDAAGILHFSNYFKFMEAAEAALFRQLDIPLFWSDDPHASYGFPRINVNCRFKRPVRFGDKMHIELSISEISGSRISYAFVFKIDKDASKLKVADGTMTTVLVKSGPNGEFASISLPEEHLERLKTFINEKTSLG